MPMMLVIRIQTRAEESYSSRLILGNNQNVYQAALLFGSLFLRTDLDGFGS